MLVMGERTVIFLFVEIASLNLSPGFRSAIVQSCWLLNVGYKRENKYVNKY